MAKENQINAEAATAEEEAEEEKSFVVRSLHN